MRFIGLTLLLPLIFGCSKSKPEGSFHKQLSAELVDPFLPKNDSLTCINFIERFEETSEFFSYIFPENLELWSLIKEMGDSVVYRDPVMFNTRTRIPIEKASLYFDLRGISHIIILNEKHQKLSTGKLSRIEYYENTIDAGFVAIYQAENSKIKEAKYCIGNLYIDLTVPRFEIFMDISFDISIQEFLGSDTSQYWRSKHYRLSDDLIYSVITSDTTSYILEAKNGIFKKLYESEVNEVISTSITPPIQIMGKPIFLVEAGISQSDITWNSLLVFNGQKYQRKENNKLIVNSID